MTILINVMTTPEWNERDYEICKKYDEKVKQGKMKYTKIKVV